MERAGIVTEVKGDTAVVRMQRHLACEGCGRCGVFSDMEKKREMLVEAANPVGAGVGQRVVIETDDRQALFLSFMLYMVPLAALVAGVLLWPVVAAALGLTGNQDLAAVGAGFGLMALVFLGLRFWDGRARKTGRFRPVITGLVEEEEKERAGE